MGPCLAPLLMAVGQAWAADSWTFSFNSNGPDQPWFADHGTLFNIDMISAAHGMVVSDLAPYSVHGDQLPGRFA